MQGRSFSTRRSRPPPTSAPILVLHGERDSIVPIAFGEKLFALAQNSKTLPKRMVRFPQGGHVDLDDFGAAKIVKEFLAALPAPD